jgi:hypothetical protein
MPNLVTTDHSQSNETRFAIDLEGKMQMQVIVSPQGIILDAFDGDEHVGTQGMMYDEWYEWVSEVAPFDLPNTDCRHCGERIHMKGVYVDNTGGDVCCADKFTEKNENGQHQP